ncbi:ligand-binding sensor domain-containing protein [Dyadobacter sandarakinus]|uniref:Regulator n=1 Tax=Dyadobacter sandarakinus TaxID=2747268 RepID=A0ABX7IA72_9BACT|nr:two-component regulator propeller domain-containing protein [Dyadobacter sandarakinus]QRR02337.1 regulator [Dyadobacter sandarakinus]
MIRLFSRFLAWTCPFLIIATACEQKQPDDTKDNVWQDKPFWQEYHDAYPVSAGAGTNEVRSIAADPAGNIWIATAAGFFTKQKTTRTWTGIPLGNDPGPAYRVAIDSKGMVWLGAWDGLYRYQNGKTIKHDVPKGPISMLCAAKEGMYAMGPQGMWLQKGDQFIPQKGLAARSLRDVVSDEKGGLWIATDAGLFHWQDSSSTHFYQTDQLISGYTKGLAYDAGHKLWVGGLGGVTVRNTNAREKELRVADGIPSVFVTTVRHAPDSTMWVGTETGVVRYLPDGSHSLRFSRRWLLDDHVNDIAFDREGTAWIATPQGVSAIRKKRMTLAEKELYFQDVLQKRHIRAPWIAGQAHLRTPGDTASWEPEDDDNDGEYTGNYLAMESFRYAATKDPQARTNAHKAFGFLKLLQEVTGTEGFFARTIIPSGWKQMHDGNRTYTRQELADELVKEPRFKPVEVRWHKSADGKWLWKGDTSSDEMCGHMFGYYFYYTLAADAAEKKVIAAHVSRIVDYLIKNKLNLADVDGKATRWSVWSPDQLNRDPEWLPDRNQNSMEMLAFLKLAYFMTGYARYEQQYLHLIKKEQYLKNMSAVTSQNPAWLIYFDLVLQAYVYPILIKCEKDPERVSFYKKHMEQWYQLRRGDQNPLINFIYNYCTNRHEEVQQSVNFLVDTPLDLIDWPIDHSKREDVTMTRTPVLDDRQVSPLQPASLRMTVRWDKNPWTLAGGNPQVEREPVFWLLPYWMGRYLGQISK